MYENVFSLDNLPTVHFNNEKIGKLEKILENKSVELKLNAPFNKLLGLDDVQVSIRASEDILGAVQKEIRFLKNIKYTDFILK